MLRSCAFSYTSDGVGWGGGRDVNVPCTSYITCCYAVEISVGVQKFLQSRVESKDSRLHIQFCVEMQCGQGCEIERTWHVGKDLQVKNTKTSFFFNVWGQNMNASTTVNSWKRLQSHANTNRNASHVKMRMSQNPGRVAKLQTEMLEKRSNCAGSLRAAWPCFWFSIRSIPGLLLRPPPPAPPPSHNLSPTTLSHTTCHPQLCHTQLVTHNLSPTTLSHTTCHPQLCHTQLVTHNFVTHNLSHTTCHPQLCHTQLVTHNFVTHTTCHTHNLSPTTLSHATRCHTQLVTWQACHLATSTCVLRGRHGTWRHVPSFHVAGVALGDIYLRRGRRGTYGMAGSGGALGLG